MQLIEGLGVQAPPYCRIDQLAALISNLAFYAGHTEGLTQVLRAHRILPACAYL